MMPLNFANITALASILFFLTGCANIEGLTKPQDPYYSAHAPEYLEKITDKLALRISCIPDDGAFGKDTKPAATKQCVYKSVDESFVPTGGNVTTVTALSAYFAECPRTTGTSCEIARNRVIDVLVKVTNDNCSNFLQNTFLRKSTADSAYNFGRDALTGGTAAVAIASPPSAVGLSLGNLLLRSYESFNKTFFLNEAFQPLENAINLARIEKLAELHTECEVDSTNQVVSYNKCSINKALTKVKEYGDSCTLRVGLNKLQSLVHQSKNTAEVEKLRNEKNALVVEKEKAEKELQATKSQDKVAEFGKQIEQLRNSIMSQQHAIEKLTPPLPEKPPVTPAVVTTPVKGADNPPSQETPPK